MDIGNRFLLCEQSKELLISQADAPLFSRQFIRMAGITEAVDQYLCARRAPLHHTLVLTTEGAGELLVAGHTYPLLRSSLAILKKGQSFQYQLEGSVWKFVWFILEDHSHWQALSELPLSLDNVTCNDKIRSMLFLIASDIPTETKSFLNRDAYQLLSDSLRLPGGQPPTDKRLQNLFFEVAEQLQFPWDVKKLAEKMHCSEPTLHRMSLKHFGESPMQKVINLRIERTRFLLKNTEWRLTDIAMQVGYKDGLSLSKAFKKKTGLSPEEFRYPSV